LVSLRELAEALGMDAMVEVHDTVELKLAVATGASLIGVNNRDLRTFQVSLETSIELAGEAPEDAVLISESGLTSATDLQRLRSVGYRGFLIGESLMRAENPEELLRSFLGAQAARPPLRLNRLDLSIAGEPPGSQSDTMTLIKICGITNFADARGRGSRS
jgi:indole-3-glycerol phosphate synthase